jgi:predicted amidohydrolase
MNTSVQVAACRYPIQKLASFDAYARKVRRLVQSAVDQGAQMLLFPEYASGELISLLSPELQGDLLAQRGGLQPFLGPYMELHRDLACKHQIYILAGTFLEKVGTGFRNRAHFFTPDGESFYQDKIHLTSFESGDWQIDHGHTLRVFETRFGKVGVAICYDVQFPNLGHQLVEAGAQLILVPSCTDDEASFQRVRIAARARALENQCYVAHSCTIGKADWSEAFDINVGHAAIYGPMDRGFAPDGRIADGRTRWVVTNLIWSRLDVVRKDGEVHNLADNLPHKWPLKHVSA